MKATKIYYKKLFSLGNYENEEIGIELQIGENERAADVLKQAERFVNSKGDPAQLIKNYEYYKSIVKNPDSYTVATYNEAKEFLEKVDPQQELPF